MPIDQQFPSLGNDFSVIHNEPFDADLITALPLAKGAAHGNFHSVPQTGHRFAYGVSV